MRILIATGIYPPAIGGPAKYAEQVKYEWENMGHKVYIRTFGFEYRLPSFIRHLYYFLKIIPAVIRSDFIFALDTLSVGWPATCIARIFGKKIIMRAGGDFLWENYVERTGDLVLLRDFYNQSWEKWSRKEKIIFKITKWTLHHVDTLIFSTEWQRDIWMKPYNLEKIKIKIIENKYGEKNQSYEPDKKDFIGGARPIKWKNIAFLKKSFDFENIIKLGAKYYTETCPYDSFMEKISRCYAVILISLGDISPNMILDAIHYNKPFIITEENGLMNRIKDIAITVDPKNIDDIREKIIWLSQKDNYDKQVEKIKNFNFVHTYREIASEILNVYKII